MTVNQNRTELDGAIYQVDFVVLRDEATYFKSVRLNGHIGLYTMLTFIKHRTMELEGIDYNLSSCYYDWLGCLHIEVVLQSDDEKLIEEVVANATIYSAPEFDPEAYLGNEFITKRLLKLNKGKHEPAKMSVHERLQAFTPYIANQPAHVMQVAYIGKTGELEDNIENAHDITAVFSSIVSERLKEGSQDYEVGVGIHEPFVYIETNDPDRKDMPGYHYNPTTTTPRIVCGLLLQADMLNHCELANEFIKIMKQE